MKDVLKVLHCNSYETLNLYLREGWILIGVCTKAFVDQDTGEANKRGDQYFSYSIGWPRDFGDIRVPSEPHNLKGIDVQ